MDNLKAPGIILIQQISAAGLRIRKMSDKDIHNFYWNILQK